jgi:hypothetical protein
MKKHIIFTIFALIIAILTTACSSSSSRGIPSADLGNNTIAGRVLNSAGQPVPNAEVLLYPSKNAHQASLAQMALASTSNLATLRLSASNQELKTTTNQNGEYAFTNVPDGEYTLLAMAGNALQFVQSGIVANSTRGATIPVDPVLIPTGSATGQLQLNGNPVKGAVLYLENTRSVAITDSNGLFAFSGIAAGHYQLALLETPIPSDIDQLITAEPVPLTIEAASTAELPTIHITTRPAQRYQYLATGGFSTTEPVDSLAGIILLAIHTNPTQTPSQPAIRGAYAYAEETVELAYGLTDENGQYQITFRKTGNYLLMPLNPPADLALEPSLLSISIGEGHAPSSPLAISDFSLLKTYLIQGQLKRESGAAIAHASIAFYAPTLGGHMAKTSAEGEFTLKLPKGSYQVQVPGHLISEGDSLEVTGDATLTITADPPAGEQFGEVSGAVLEDDTYEPMAHMPIYFKNGLEQLYVTQTDASGYYSIELPYGSYSYSAGDGFYFPSSAINVDAQTVVMPTIDDAVRWVPMTPSPTPLTTVETLADVRGVEVIGETVYVISIHNGLVRINSYSAMDRNFDDMYEPKDIGGEAGDIRNVSTKAYNNMLYITITDASNSSWLHILNENLSSHRVQSLPAGYNSYDLLDDGLSLMYIQNGSESQAYEDATATIKGIGSVEGANEIEISSHIRHFVPAIVPQSKVYYPDVEYINFGGSEPEPGLIIREHNYNYSSPTNYTVAQMKLRDIGVELGMGPEDAEELSAEHIKTCHLTLDNGLQILVQIDYDGKTHYISTNPVDIKYNQYLEITGTKTDEDPNYLLSNFYYDPPKGSITMPNNKADLLHVYNNLGEEGEFVKIINPYRYTKEKGYLIGSKGDKLAIYVIYEDNWNLPID